MIFAKRAGWIVIGVVIGVFGATSLGAVQQQQSKKDDARLVFAEVSNNRLGDSTAFVKDTKGTGCWLAFFHGNGAAVSLAPAPSTACR